MIEQFPNYWFLNLKDFNQDELKKIIDENENFSSEIKKYPIINKECASHRKYLNIIKDRIEKIINYEVKVSSEKNKKIDSDKYLSIKMNTSPLSNCYVSSDNIFYIDPLFLKEIASYNLKQDLFFVDKMKNILWFDENSKVFLAWSVRTFENHDEELLFSYYLYKRLKKEYWFNKFIYCHRWPKKDTTKELLDILEKNEKYNIVKKDKIDIIKKDKRKKNEEIFIIESFWILDKLYFLSDLSFIWWSTNWKRDGHSIRESLIAWVPYISWKFMSNNWLLYDESIKDWLWVSLTESIKDFWKGDIKSIASEIIKIRMETKADFSNFNKNLEDIYNISLYYKEKVIWQILESIKY